MKNLAQFGSKLALVLFVLFSISVAEMACATGPIRQQASPALAPQVLQQKAEAESKAYGRVPNTEANSITKDPVYKDTPTDAKPPGDTDTAKCTGPQVQTCVKGSSECVNGDTFFPTGNNSYAQCLSSNGVCTGVSKRCSVD